VRELEPGLWHRQGTHPQWESGEPSDPKVSSYVEHALIEPLSMP
jgi:hypothetical protein